MSSWMVPMISVSVIGRPSISAWSTASTTSPRGGSWRRRSMKSAIQANTASQQARASGLSGTAARMVRSLTSATASGGALRNRSKNPRPGNGRANSAMKSQRPASMNPSMRRVTSWRVAVLVAGHHHRA